MAETVTFSARRISGAAGVGVAVGVGVGVVSGAGASSAEAVGPRRNEERMSAPDNRDIHRPVAIARLPVPRTRADSSKRNPRRSIAFPYAGVTRIRFKGLISGPLSRLEGHP
jgi:hypothetical protein